MKLPILRLITRKARRERIAVLIQKAEIWESQGLGIFSELAELTDPDDDLGVECRRVRDLLAG